MHVYTHTLDRGRVTLYRLKSFRDTWWWFVIKGKYLESIVAHNYTEYLTFLAKNTFKFPLV